MQTGNADSLCRNELDKACFQHDMAYGKSKDLVKRTLIKSLVEVVLTLNQIIRLQMNFIDRLLKNLREEKFIHLLETIFGVLI